MLKQTIVISSPCRLSLRNSLMVIAVEDRQEATRPIADIGIVIVESQRAVVTTPLLAALAEAGVVTVLCDARAMPAAVVSPIDANTTQALTRRYQYAATEPARKQAWRQVVEAKIRAQADALLATGHDPAPLTPYYQNVRSGDTDNREGLAARLYWRAMYGDGWIRDRYGLPPNAMLNYGYAVLRAAMARALLASGLDPALGIFHHNRNNAFPLADDMMEPFRPVVDVAVYRLHAAGCVELTPDVRRTLVGLLTADVIADGSRRPLTVAMTAATASLAKYFRAEVRKLTLPTMAFGNGT